MACLLPGLLRAPAGGQQQPGGRLSAAGRERLWVLPWRPLKHLCLTSEWSVSAAGDGGDGPGSLHGCHLRCPRGLGAGSSVPCWVGVPGVPAKGQNAALPPAQGEPGGGWPLPPAALGLPQGREVGVGLAWPRPGVCSQVLPATAHPRPAAGALPGAGMAAARAGAVRLGRGVRVWPSACF